MIGLGDIEAARDRLKGVVRPTPVVGSTTLTALVGRTTLVKPEHLQRTGSFKIRGAYNKIAVLANEGCSAVVAASAGNHGQGVALAASLCGLTSTVFMPSDASLPKVEATRTYGAAVSLDYDNIDSCIVAARAFAQRTGAAYVPPFDDPLVVAGQGTAGLEIASEAPGTAVVVVPVGGGGLISGIAVALAGRSPGTRVVGVEPSGAASMSAALRFGAPVALSTCETMADGVAVREVSELTLEHVRALVDDLVTVEEEEISRAVLLLLERCKWVVEPAGALGLAALLAGKVPGADSALAVLSGGNVDPLLLTHLIEHGLTAAGRYFQVRVHLRDRPGVLAELARILGDLHLNIVTVEHRRSGARVAIGEVEVLLTVETRDSRHRAQVMDELRARGVRAEILE
jgi:threonine dehydratase